MNRRTRTLQYFASPDETKALLRRLVASSVHVFEVEAGSCREAHVAAGTVEIPRRLFVGTESDLAGEAHRQPARWGLVVFDTPILSGGELRMAVLGAVNAWSEGGSGLTDDRSLRLFDRLKKAISVDFVGSVDVRSRSTGQLRNYPAIRTTAGALALWERGVRFVQDGVAGLDYLPNGTGVV